MAYVEQQSEFAAGVTVRSIVAAAVQRAAVPEEERERREVEWLGRAGFENFEAEAAALSGGWRKRLAIVGSAGARPAGVAAG